MVRVIGWLLALVLAATGLGTAHAAPDGKGIPANILGALRMGGANLVFHWYDVAKFRANGFDDELPLIKAAGGGHVRLAISMDAIEDGTTGHLRADRWGALKAFVEKARANGLVTIIDIHNTGQKAPDGSWTHDYMYRIVDPDMQTRHLTLLGEIAERTYGELDRNWVVIGPGNEPLAYAWYGYQDRLMPVIRAKCPDCVVMAMAIKWQVVEETITRLKPRERTWWDDRFVVDVHMYSPLSLTHCSFPGQPNTCPGKTWPGVYDDHMPTGGRFSGEWNKAVLERSMGPLWTWAAENRVFVHLSEIGTTSSLDDGPRGAYLEDVVSILQANGAGWSCWEWHMNFGIKNAPRSKAACLKGPKTPHSAEATK
jgi:hypothetical protein